MNKKIQRICAMLTLLLAVSERADALEQDSTIVENSTKVTLTDTTAVDTCQYQKFSGVQFDSTLIQGSTYGSFADIFDQLPGTYYFDRGSVGQLAEGFLFGGTPSFFLLDYDGLILNDPITGKAHLNLVPVESINNIGLLLSSVDSNSMFNTIGQTLQINSVDLAALPIRSRVAYRTGTGYDDVDARLGVQVSPILKINVGGILKNYSGTQFFSQYRAQKINLKIDRTFYNDWHFRYVLLANKFDLDVPYLENYNVPGEFRLPHQKDVRYDHGFILKRGRFKSTLQYTNLVREFYGYRHSVVDQLHKVNSLRLENKYNVPMSLFDLNIGARWNWDQLKSNEWGHHTRWDVAGKVSVLSTFSNNLLIVGDLQLNKTNNYSVFFQPAINLTWLLKQNIRLNSWYNRLFNAPNFESLYSAGPFRLGNEALSPEQMDQIGVAVNLSSQKVNVNIAHSFQHIKNHISVLQHYNEKDLPKTSDYQYANLENFQRYAFDAKGEYKFNNFLKLVTKGNIFVDFGSDVSMTNMPDYFAKGYLELHDYIQKLALDARVRIGGELLGPYLPSSPYSFLSTVLSDKTEIQSLPYVHALFIVRDVTLFVALLNPFNVEYQRLYNSPHPKAQLRWGFAWNFID
jgi:outer membrane cobalamin receptor